MKTINGYDILDYINMPAKKKTEFFLDTRSSLKFPADYWIDFSKVREYIDEYGADLYTLDYLINRDQETVKQFFIERPHLLKLIPVLLGIRREKYNSGNANGFLDVQHILGEYKLNFNAIDIKNIDLYMKFIRESGLLELLERGLSKSVRDYVVGIEAGLNTNARKNRSGNLGEWYLSELLKDIANRRGWQSCGQTTADTAKKKYGLEMDEIFANRRFDGSLFDKERRKLFLFEVNNFNSAGSKVKASSTEFQVLHDRFSRTNHKFIYITDGEGWNKDKSHLYEAMSYIGLVFNYEMCEAGWIDAYLSL
ncbi:DpnII family type II restriction endonuclease [Listeria sp. ILCC797]|uniref:DpnII family type II restriction endonuclease n=1 Tax=Listeria sp. ILCC797 TaxID=1918333 RepID=UPI000B587815|nr:DpnII family type II restriction endonuclease [Listeria sp. ILCC797]